MCGSGSGCNLRPGTCESIIYIIMYKSLQGRRLAVPATLFGRLDFSLKKLERYAKNIGMTFQIKDDLLSVNGDFTKLGKPIGSDARNQKCTFVTLLGEKKATEILSDLTQEAIIIASEFGSKGDFLKELAASSV